MMVHPGFDPVLLHLGPLAIRWYAVSYIAGFCLFMWLGRIRIKSGRTQMTKTLLDDLLTYGVIGVILGGRLGYVLFYQPHFYLTHPLDILKVWEGGMSFHGGFLGVLVAMYVFARRHNISVVSLADFVAPLIPPGLACGRIGNFINGELWGRLTSPDAFWAMGFPGAAAEDAAAVAQNPERWLPVWEQYHMLPRHPSQLYQFALEGVALFAVLWIYSGKPRPAGRTASLFLIGYGLCRFVVEFAREPDSFLGLLAGSLSMGQWLSLPMILLGLVGWFYFGRRAAREAAAKP